MLSTILQKPQVAKYPSLANETLELNCALMAIKPKTLTLDQRDAVKTFFTMASSRFEKVN